MKTTRYYLADELLFGGWSFLSCGLASEGSLCELSVNFTRLGVASHIPKPFYPPPSSMPPALSPDLSQALKEEALRDAIALLRTV